MTEDRSSWDAAAAASFFREKVSDFLIHKGDTAPDPGGGFTGNFIYKWNCTESQQIKKGIADAIV